MKYICSLNIRIKSVLWRVVKRLSYKEEARCLKVKLAGLRCVPLTYDNEEQVSAAGISGHSDNFPKIIAP